MATPVKFYDYIEQVNKGVHNWSTHTFKAGLTNSAPVNTNTIYANITEIAAGNGYVAGGMVLDTVTLTETSGIAKVTVADEVLTATGAVATFRYVAYYNDTATSPADALIVYYDHGTGVTLANTETFTLDHDPTNGLWQAT